MNTIQLKFVWSLPRIGETIICKDKKRRLAKVAVDVDIDAVKKIFFDTIETGF